MAISFFFLDTQITLAERKRLKLFIGQMFKNNGKRLKSLNYIFCTDDYLLEINQKYLKHDYYTDIMTFDLSKKGEDIEGEIYVSVDRVRDNARILGVTIKEELHRIIFHGALHLCGYSDKRHKDKLEMRVEEDKNLNLYLS